VDPEELDAEPDEERNGKRPRRQIEMKRRLSLKRPITNDDLGKKIGTLHYATDVSQVITSMYRKLSPHLIYDSSILHHINPKTRRSERFISHPVSADWWQHACEEAKKLHPNQRTHVVGVILYSDSTGAEDRCSHHPVYISLANSDLDTFQSMAGRETVAFLPNLEEPVGITKPHLARLRAALFQRSMARLIDQFVNLHKKVTFFVF
jgi:hypothetical protein